MRHSFCKNHPLKSSSYRCFQCKNAICQECRRHLAHHYFCSYKCFLSYRILNLSKKAKPYSIGILAFFQILLFILIAIVWFRSDHNPLALNEFKSPPLPDSAYFSALKELINDRSISFDGFTPEVLEDKAEHHHILELPLESQSVINIWRNDAPVITENVEEKGIVPFSIPLDYGKNSIKVLVIDPIQHVLIKQQYVVMYQNPQVELFRKSIERGNADRKKLALTFDAGSDDSNTREILKILKDQQLKCTLFLTGKFMEQNVELVKEMLASGHEIANHTYDHPHLTTYEQNFQHQLSSEVGRDFLQHQLLKTDSIFYTISERHLTPYWRAPFGEYNSQILTWAAEAGYLHIHWTGSFDTHDWVTDESSQLYRSPEEIFEDILAIETEHPQGLNGVIVLMHLGSQRNENHVYEILPKLIESIRNKAYVFGNITELLN